MLAYVFWHWPGPGVAPESYVDHLAKFHDVLASNKPSGFQRSTVFRIRDAKWLDTNGEAFEDWYVLDDSAALDRLSDAAVSGACEEPHNLVAREAAGGVAGLYRVQIAGLEPLTESRFALWLAKPPGVSYQDFYDAFQPISPRVSLWQRQMTLGPTTEFCFHSPKPFELPDGYTGTTVPLELIWPR
jgi:hypothetical protein